MSPTHRRRWSMIKKNENSSQVCDMITSRNAFWSGCHSLFVFELENLRFLLSSSFYIFQLWKSSHIIIHISALRMRDLDRRKREVEENQKVQKPTNFTRAVDFAKLLSQHSSNLVSDISRALFKFTLCVCWRDLNGFDRFESLKILIIKSLEKWTLCQPCVVVVRKRARFQIKNWKLCVRAFRVRNQSVPYAGLRVYGVWKMK